MLSTYKNMSVSTISIICHSKFINAEKHQITWNKWYSKLGSDPSRKFFHEIQLDLSKYAKYLNWYVCSLYTICQVNLGFMRWVYSGG